MGLLESFEHGHSLRKYNLTGQMHVPCTPRSVLEVWYPHARSSHHSIETWSLRGYFLFQVWERAPGFGDVLLTDTIWEAINEVTGSPNPLSFPPYEELMPPGI